MTNPKSDREQRPPFEILASKEVQAAIQAAQAAGQYLETYRHAPKLDTAERDYLPTTDEDRGAEQLITKILQEQFPGYGLLGEEYGAVGNQAIRWIVDPIDGTNNYLADRDTYSVSIALERNGIVELGVVCLSARNELFVAELGKGAFLNGTPLHVPKPPSLEAATITFSPYPGHEEQYRSLRHALRNSVPRLEDFGFDEEKRVNPTFGFGSMAAEFCYVAVGRLHGLVRLKQKAWDGAAGALIAAESGARVTNLFGEPSSLKEGDFVAAHPALHESLLRAIEKAA